MDPDPLGAAIASLTYCNSVLRAVPRGPYGPTTIGIIDISDDLMSDLNCEVVCPLAVPAASLLVDTSAAGVVAHTAAGSRSILLRLVLAEGCRESRQSPRELRLSVEAVCRHVVATASHTDSSTGRVTELVCVAAPLYSDTGLLIALSAEIPVAAAGSVVNVASISVGGQVLNGFSACRLPVCVAPQCPWVHKDVGVIDYEVTPAVTATGCVMRSPASELQLKQFPSSPCRCVFVPETRAPPTPVVDVTGAVTPAIGSTGCVERVSKFASDLCSSAQTFFRSASAAPSGTRVFSSAGAPLDTIIDSSLGGQDTLHAVACGTDDLILLVGRKGRLSLFEASTREMRWTVSPDPDLEPMSLYLGAAILAKSGVAVFTLEPRGGDALDDQGLLEVRSLSDGARLCRVPAPVIGLYMAADSVSNVVYVGDAVAPCGVRAFKWSDSAGSLELVGTIAAITPVDNCRPLAVVPPAPGSRTSHLVVGCIWSSHLVVLALPGHTVVHTFSVAPLKVTGLAADPTGTALVICGVKLDARSERIVKAVSWPLDRSSLRD